MPETDVKQTAKELPKFRDHQVIKENINHKGWISEILEWAGPILLGMMGILFVAFVYLIGWDYYDSSLAYFGISSNSFPLGREMYLIYGAALVSGFGAIHSIKIFWNIAIIIVSFWAIAGFMLELKNIIFEGNKLVSNKRRMAQVWHWVRVPVFLFLIYFLWWFASLRIGLLILLPASIVENSSRVTATDYEKIFKEGVASRYRGHPFVRLKSNNGNKLIAAGFVIARSKERVALYCKNKTEEHGLEGLHLEIDLGVRDESEKDKKGSILEGSRVDCQKALAPSTEQIPQLSPRPQPSQSSPSQQPSKPKHRSGNSDRQRCTQY